MCHNSGINLFGVGFCFLMFIIAMYYQDEATDRRRWLSYMWYEHKHTKKIKELIFKIEDSMELHDKLIKFFDDIKR